MKNRPLPWVTGAMVALSLGAACWDHGVAAFALERARVLHGDVWRLWTGHLVHFGPSHLAWNLIVFAASGAWAECVALSRTRIFYAVAPLAISLALIFFAPTLTVYAGLSGVAAGVLTLLAGVQLGAAGRTDRRFWFAVLGLLAAKAIVEMMTGGPVFARFDTTDIRAVPLAHLAGVVVAIAVLFLGRVRSH